MPKLSSSILSLTVVITVWSSAGIAQCPYSKKGAQNTSVESGDSKTTKGSFRENVNHTDEGKFKKDVLEAKQPVVVDFYASWCGPCQRLSPMIESISKTYSGKVSFLKVDVDKNPKLAEQYGIMSIPAIMMFKEGKLVDNSVGLPSEAQLKKKVDKLL